MAWYLSVIYGIQGGKESNNNFSYAIFPFWSTDWLNKYDILINLKS